MRIIVRTADKVIFQYSPEGRPEPGEGCVAVDLTDEQEAAFEAARATPNVGITFDGRTFTVLPLPAPVVPPAACTNVQLRLELAARGKLEQAKSLVAASGLEAEVAFEYTAEYTSDNPLLLALAPRIGIPAETVRDVILAASRRKVGAR